MKSQLSHAWAALSLSLLAWPALVLAQTPDRSFQTEAPPETSQPEVRPIDPEPPVIEYHLSGPRLGATFTPAGEPSSQFGWHFEHQAAPGSRGPWFIVETVMLVAGVERDAFIPSGTLIFGIRTPSSFELGVGPSLTLGGRQWSHTAVVVAAGHSFRMGGIRIPLNLAVALDKDGDERWTLLTGWAIREKSYP